MPGEYQGEFFAKHGYDKLSWPKFIEVTRSRWKGNTDKIEITQMLHANVIEGGEYCSVAAVLYLLRYYSLCGIKDDGPLFRKFHKDKKSGNMVPVEANFSVECKVGKGSSTYMKWYAEREKVKSQTLSFSLCGKDVPSFRIHSLLLSHVRLVTSFRPYACHAQPFYPSRMAFHFLWRSR